MSTILNVVWAFILAHPTEDTAVLGALITFVFSLFQKAIASSPRVAAFYSLLCRVFPDASDPKALAADFVMLFTGKPKSPESGPKSAARLGKVLPLAVLCMAFSLTGCAAFKRDAKTVLDIVQNACILAAPLDASVPDLALACGIAEADIPLLEKMIAARKAGASLKPTAAK